MTNTDKIRDIGKRIERTRTLTENQVKDLLYAIADCFDELLKEKKSDNWGG